MMSGQRTCEIACMKKSTLGSSLTLQQCRCSSFERGKIGD